MKPPADMSLPYFDYGLFKPGELPFKQIEKFLDGDPESKNLDGLSLFRRDGIPLLIPRKIDNPVRGVVLRFREETSDEAYQVISNFVGQIQYNWGIIDFGEQGTFNVLWGTEPDQGADETPFHHWTVRNDPIFREGMAVIRQVIEDEGRVSLDILPNRWETLFKLQMAYLLLWSAIERYCYFAYGLNLSPKEKRDSLAAEDIFKDALKTVLKKAEHSTKRRVYNFYDINRLVRLDYYKARSSIEYYYLVRNNIAHRGKDEDRDFEIIKYSLIELHEIFQIVLHKTIFGEKKPVPRPPDWH